MITVSATALGPSTYRPSRHQISPALLGGGVRGLAQPCRLLIPKATTGAICWARSGAHPTQHPVSNRQQVIHKQQPATFPLAFSYPLQYSAQGARQPEVVSLHLINLDHSTKALNSISKPDEGLSCLAPQGSPASAHSIAQGAGPDQCWVLTCCSCRSHSNRDQGNSRL